MRSLVQELYNLLTFTGSKLSVKTWLAVSVLVIILIVDVSLISTENGTLIHSPVCREHNQWQVKSVCQIFESNESICDKRKKLRCEVGGC